MRRGLFYGWIVVAVTAVVMVVTAGVRSAPGAFIVAMTDEPGWTTGAISFVAAVGLVVFGLAGPLSGWLMGRFGVRNIVLLSVVITALALVATSLRGRSGSSPCSSGWSRAWARASSRACSVRPWRPAGSSAIAASSRVR